MLRQIRQLSLLTLALAACKEPASPAPAPKPAAPVVDTAQTYELNIASPGPFVAGKESVAAITVTAKAGFHVNPEYPVTFKPEGSEAVKFAEAQRVPLTAGAKTPCADKAEDACKVEFPLTLTPEQAGPAKVAGVLAFSVCSADKCLIEKVPLSLAIKVD